MVTAITGLPGTGKSFFAAALASRIHCKHISSDAVRFKLKHLGRYDAQAKMLVYDTMLEQMEKAIKAGENVVLDATFYKRMIRQRFKDKASVDNTPFYFINMEATELVIKERISKHRPDSEADFQDYLIVKNEYEPVTENHLTLHSDQETLSDMLDKALTFINYHDESSRN
jgi:predicted kinase